jgi:hypothetical protein
VETLIARRIIAGDVEPGSVLKVDLDENGAFVCEAEKPEA